MAVVTTRRRNGADGGQPSHDSTIVPAAHRPAILIVDPDRASRTPLAHVLSERYAVYEAEDGLVALRLATMVPEIALVLSEVKLPTLDGVDLAKLFKAHADLCDVPFVFLGPRASRSEIFRLLSAGARSYVRKSLSPAAVAKVVTRLLRHTATDAA
jgi:DNA-binding response OmpR family regulator